MSLFNNPRCYGQGGRFELPEKAYYSTMKVQVIAVTSDERKQLKREKRKAKRAAKGLPTRKQGSLKSEMEHRIRQRTRKEGAQLSYGYRDRAIQACYAFDEWRKVAGWTNAQVRDNRREAVEAWVQSLQQDITKEEKQQLPLRRKMIAYQPASIHTMTAYVCLGLGIDMSGITKSGTVLDKKKSTGLSARYEHAQKDEKNRDIIRLAELVGGRRAAYSRLTGVDFVRDESGEYCVRFLHDKGGKTQYQRIAPEHVKEVYTYFQDKAADEQIFPEKLDKNLDLHGVRAEHARKEYERYAKICSTKEGRQQMRQQLWVRFCDPVVGNKAWLTAKGKGNIARMKKKEQEFAAEMADGRYFLRGANRQAALLKDRPLEYDRLALCCVSVFALSHWRNEVTVKHYMI